MVGLCGKQEVRAERDVLQARMSEQALKISSLSARLQQQRNDAEAMSHQATSHLSVQLHDALAEVPTYTSADIFSPHLSFVNYLFNCFHNRAISSV